MYYKPFEESNVSPTLRDLVSNGVVIFNDWWDTFIPEHKAELCKKIIHTYYFEQIGSETPEKFVWYLNSQLERIMPYYNQLYQSELIKIDPLLNHSINASGRSIENLLTKANTTDDKFAKAIRDFAGVTDKTEESSSIGNVKNNTATNKTGTQEYSKQGTEDITDKMTATGTEDETKKGNLTGNTIIDETGNETTNNTVERDLTGKETETPNETTVKKMDWGATETGKESMTGNTTSDGNGTKNWTETIDDDATTDTTTNLSETSTSSGEKDYADTPQKQLNIAADGSTNQIRKDYLTNVTWTDESSSHKADTTQKVDYQDDQTKTHEETTTDKNNTDKTETTDTTKTKGGTDTETDTHTGTNVTDNTEHETTVSNGTKNTTNNSNKNQTENTSETRDLDTTDNSTTTRDKDWTEHGNSSEQENITSASVTDSANIGNSSGTQQTKETSDLSQSSTSTQNKETSETTDKGTTNITSGFMNVSASSLLEAFRKTFLNIDNMIIEELRDNFMLIY